MLSPRLVKESASVIAKPITNILKTSIELPQCKVMQFLFHLVGTSDFQCVGSFPGFLKTLQLNLLVLISIPKGSIEEAVGVFLDGGFIERNFSKERGYIV